MKVSSVCWASAGSSTAGAAAPCGPARRWPPRGFGLRRSEREVMSASSRVPALASSTMGTREYGKRLGAGGGSAHQARQLELEQGRPDGGRCQAGGRGEAGEAQHLAVAERLENRPRRWRGDGGANRPCRAAATPWAATPWAGTAPGTGAVPWAGTADGAGGHPTERLQHVVQAADQGGAIADQVIAPGGARIPWRAGDDQHTTAAPAAARAGGGEATRLAARLHHHDSGRQRGDQAVAWREVRRERPRAGRVLGEQRAARGPGSAEQRDIGTGVGHVEAAAEHDDGTAAGIQS